jgi:hypothetical protein
MTRESPVEQGFSRFSAAGGSTRIYTPFIAKLKLPFKFDRP